MKRLAPLLLLGLAVACGEKETPKAPPPVDTGEKAPGPSTDDIKVATTGVSVIQRDHDALLKDVVKLEERKKNGETVNQRYVKQHLAHCEILITATERALGPEARKMVRARVLRMRKRYAEFDARALEIREEIRTIQEMVASARQGISALPEGYTEAELLDNVGDLELDLAKHEKEREEFRKELDQAEKLLAQENIPPQGDTMFTRELEALEKTKARIEALLES